MTNQIKIESCPNCQSYHFKKIEKVWGVQLKKCLNCELVYVEKFIVGNEDEVYGKNFFAPYQENNYKHTGKSEVQKLCLINQFRINSILKLNPPGKLLDYGCGQGYFLKTAVANNLDAIGLDISDLLVDHGGKK